MLDVTKENLGTIISSYILLRDKKEEMSKRHKEEMSTYNTSMGNIEMAMLEYLNAESLTKVGSDEGLAYTKDYNSAKVEDRTAFLEFCMTDDERLPLMDVRANAKIIKQYMDEEGALPPGVEFSSFKKVVINRGK